MASIVSRRAAGGTSGDRAWRDAGRPGRGFRGGGPWRGERPRTGGDPRNAPWFDGREGDDTVTRRERFLVGIVLTLSLALPVVGLYWFNVGFREGRSSTALFPYRGPGRAVSAVTASPCREP